MGSSSVPRNRSERIDTKKRKGCKEGRKSSNPPTPVASLVPQTSPHLIPPTERAGKLQRRSHSMGGSDDVKHSKPFSVPPRGRAEMEGFLIFWSRISGDGPGWYAIAWQAMA